MSTIEQMIKEAQETNNKELYVQIGNAYILGRGVAKDMSKAIPFFEKACNLGSLDGKTKLGICYYNGFGVSKNSSLAKKYFQEAAKQDWLPAIFQLGNMCFNGDYGFLASKGKAFEFWMKAAKKGHSDSQYNIAGSYLTDEWGEEKSFEKAAFWYMCAYQNRQSSKSTITDSKKYLDYLSKYVNLNSVKERVVRQYPQYLNL